LEIFPPVVLSHAGDAGEKFLSRAQSVTEDHQQATDNGEVAEKEVEVEDETVTEALDNDDTEETADSIFRIALPNDRGRAGQHGEDVHK